MYSEQIIALTYPYSLSEALLHQVLHFTFITSNSRSRTKVFPNDTKFIN